MGCGERDGYGVANGQRGYGRASRLRVLPGGSLCAKQVHGQIQGVRCDTGVDIGEITERERGLESRKAGKQEDSVIVCVRVRVAVPVVSPPGYDGSNAGASALAHVAYLPLSFKSQRGNT